MFVMQGFQHMQAFDDASTFTPLSAASVCSITLTHREALCRTRFSTVLGGQLPSTISDKMWGFKKNVGLFQARRLQFRRAAARAHLKLQHKCPHITAECVNRAVTSLQGHLTSSKHSRVSGLKQQHTS